MVNYPNKRKSICRSTAVRPRSLLRFEAKDISSSLCMVHHEMPRKIGKHPGNGVKPHYDFVRFCRKIDWVIIFRQAKDIVHNNVILDCFSGLEVPVHAMISKCKGEARVNAFAVLATPRLASL